MKETDEIVSELEAEHNDPDEEVLEEAAYEAVEIVNDIDETQVSVDEVDIAKDLYDYIAHQVSVDEARQSILRNIANSQDLEIGDIVQSDSGDGMSEAHVEDIDEGDSFYVVDIQVGELWDDVHESMSQKGIVYDNTDTIVFKSWEKSEKPLLTEGQSYRLKGVASDEYQGNISISINSQTEIEMIDEEFERPSNREEFIGAMVDIQSGSGLIERCTATDECTRTLSNGKCKEHGDVEGEFDLRIKGVLDNGKETKDVIIGKELTEKLSGISIEEAESIAKEALDTDAVTDRIEKEVMMQYYRVEGWKGDETTINAEEAEEYNSMDEADIEGLVGRLNSLETTNDSGQTEVN